ncbi:hypothetical protein [Bartonella rattimassiliensis]|uniref:Uncharacterized protein n=1 Tax=Bartonella rattimassiliensis 15908 TaxID=1094556 RepID=J0QPD3_9HYPH|nr:hypothetical protein [Bartonella rattimassiliensis]EJF84869.1 hypothetical protein MCY_01421 [Bartonella rattimassiliensis 15908]
MFKLFKNRICSFIFTLFIIFFVQTVEGNASFVKNKFQGEEIISTLEKSVVIKAEDRAVIYDLEGQNRFSFEKAEKVSAYSGSAFWGGIGIFSLLASLCVGDIFGTVVSILGILCTL